MNPFAPNTTLFSVTENTNLFIGHAYIYGAILSVTSGVVTLGLATRTDPASDPDDVSSWDVLLNSFVTGITGVGYEIMYPFLVDKGLRAVITGGTAHITLFHAGLLE